MFLLWHLLNVGGQIYWRWWRLQRPFPSSSFPVITNQAWIPRGGGDLVSFLYPMYRFAARSFWNGEIPLWNPYLYAGAPFVSDNQSGLFYPVNLLLFLFNPNFSYRTLQWLVLFHFWLAGAGMYVCVRGWRREDRIRPFPALLSAFTFMFSGVFIVHIGNLNLNAVMSWLPLALLALHRAIEADAWRNQLQWAVAGGLIVSVSTLAGHGQMTFMVGMFLGLYGVYRAVLDRNGRSLLMLIIVGLVGIAGAAISLIPTAAQIQYTPRAGFDFAQSTNYSLPVKALIGLFTPDFYGRGIDGYWQDWSRVEYGYAGVLPWLLIGIPFFTKQRKQALFFGIAGVFFILLALGGNSPIYALLFERLPIVPFQVPARFVVLADLCLAMLAGMGLDKLVGAGQAGNNPPKTNGLHSRLARPDASEEGASRRGDKLFGSGEGKSAPPRPYEGVGYWVWLGATAVFFTTLIIYLLITANQLGAVRPDKLGQMRTAVYTLITFAILGWGLLAAYQKGWVNARWLAITAVLLSPLM